MLHFPLLFSAESQKTQGSGINLSLGPFAFVKLFLSSLEPPLTPAWNATPDGNVDFFGLFFSLFCSGVMSFFMLQRCWRPSPCSMNFWHHFPACARIWVFHATGFEYPVTSSQSPSRWAALLVAFGRDSGTRELLYEQLFHRTLLVIQFHLCKVFDLQLFPLFSSSVKQW